jgi:hypothetical protein
MRVLEGVFFDEESHGFLQVGFIDASLRLGSLAAVMISIILSIIPGLPRE